MDEGFNDAHKNFLKQSHWHRKMCINQNVNIYCYKICKTEWFIIHLQKRPTTTTINWTILFSLLDTHQSLFKTIISHWAVCSKSTFRHTHTRMHNSIECKQNVVGAKKKKSYHFAVMKYHELRQASQSVS